MRISSPPAAQRIASLGIPVVDLLQDSHHEVPSFLADDDAVAEMAADFFVQAGFTSFAFCGYPGIAFSDRRERAFCRDLRWRGFECECYQQKPVKTASNILKHIQNGFREVESLATWLSRLTLPV